MRIAFFTQWWPPEPANIVGSLGTELARRGHDVDVVTGFPNYPSGRTYPGHRMALRTVEQSGRLRTVRVPLFPSHDRSAWRRAANYVSYAAAASTVGLASLRRPDVAYVYHPPITSAWPARLQRLLRGVPFILHVQDLWPESVVESGMLGSSRRRTLVEYSLSRTCLSTYRAAAHIIVISPGFRRLLVERGVPARKISVIMNWADEDVFGVTPFDPAARAELGPPDARIVLYAGNLGDYQGLDVAVLAAGDLGAASRLQLVLIGDGIARVRLTRLIEDRQIRNVSILPRRPASEMPRLLAAADAHLVSLADLPFFAVTIPGKTQVAMASGKFTVMGVRGDAASLVDEAGAGFACPPSREGFRKAFEDLCALPSEDLLKLGRMAHDFYQMHLSRASAVARIESVLMRSASTGSPWSSAAPRDQLQGMS